MSAVGANAPLGHANFGLLANLGNVRSREAVMNFPKSAVS